MFIVNWEKSPAVRRPVWDCMPGQERAPVLHRDETLFWPNGISCGPARPKRSTALRSSGLRTCSAGKRAESHEQKQSSMTHTGRGQPAGCLRPLFGFLNILRRMEKAAEPGGLCAPSPLFRIRLPYRTAGYGSCSVEPASCTGAPGVVN